MPLSMVDFEFVLLLFPGAEINSRTSCVCVVFRSIPWVVAVEFSFFFSSGMTLSTLEPWFCLCEPAHGLPKLR